MAGHHPAARPGINDDWEALGNRRAVGGHELFVVDVRPDVEEAEPVLVLHGFPSSGADWHHVLPVLAARRRVVIPDLLGYGFSDKPDQPYSLFAQADLVEALASDLGLDAVALVTHDMGDSVGGELLARGIDGTLGFGVERRVLTNGSIYLALADLTDGQKLLRSLPDAALADSTAPGAEALAASLRATLAPDAHADDDCAAMAELIVRGGGNRLLPRIIRYLDERAVHEARWTGAIERHPAPVTVIWGDLDPIARFVMTERLLERRPDAVLVRLDGVGHYPMIEAPERFGAALRAALS
jgi:pimeloyl-ACP methyl ester carboxylesterase